MAQSDLDALTEAARSGWLFCLPLIEVANARATGFPAAAPINTVGHNPDLVDHTFRAITTPNNDTLYSTIYMDLSKGPVSLTVPASGDRYLSVALMDAYTNNFAILGTRTTGTKGGTFKIVGPADSADGPRVVRSPTNHVWALARILVDGPHDLAAARAVQQGISSQGPEIATLGPYAPREAGWADYFSSAARLMAENPPPVTDGRALEVMEPLGLEAFDPSRFSPAEVEAIEAGVEQAQKDVRRGGGAGFVEGWSYPSASLGDFGQTYGYRATVALGGLAALPVVEAMYMRPRGPLPRALYDGTQAWRLHFPADRLLPVDSFWSLSLYESTPDGQFFFVDNPIGRYAIGDRTPGLTFNEDGSLDIWIGHDSPGPEREGNWLPAPAAPFALFMRAYLPRPELLNGRYRLPPVTEA
jgi:hypothetical protein